MCNRLFLATEMHAENIMRERNAANLFVKKCKQTEDFAARRKTREGTHFSHTRRRTEEIMRENFCAIAHECVAFGMLFYVFHSVKI